LDDGSGDKEARMDDRDNRSTVAGKWKACSFPADLPALERVYDDDAVVEYPQSGERIVGRENILEVHKHSPGGGPRITLRRVVGGGRLWFSEQAADYGGQIFHGSSVFELRDGKIVRETDYFGEPFEAPEWRAPFVERLVT